MANFGVAADAWVGIGVEHTLNSYRFPHKWLPVRSESLTTNEANVYGRQLKGTADITYVKAGNQSFSGNIEIEVLPDCMPHLIQAMRADVTYDATAQTYTVAPNQEAQLGNGKSLSITCIKNDVVFLFTGMVITGLNLTTNDMLLVARIDFMGTGETDTRQSPVFPTLAQLEATREFAAGQIPFGAGEYLVTIDGLQTFDSDTFTFEVNEGAEDQFRLNPYTRAPWFIKMGERSVSLNTSRDFNSRESYDNYKSQQQESVNILAERSDNSNLTVTIDIPHGTVDNFDLPLSGGQGDLIRADTSYMSTPRVGENSYNLIFGSEEVLPYDNAIANKLPSAVTVQNVGASGAEIQWTAGSAAATDPAVVGYVIRWRPKGGSDAEWLVANAGASDMAHTVADLASGTTYEVEVAAATPVGGSGSSVAGAGGTVGLIGEYAVTAFVSAEFTTS